MVVDGAHRVGSNITNEKARFRNEVRRYGEFKAAGLRARRYKVTGGRSSQATGQTSTKTFSGMPVARSLAN